MLTRALRAGGVLLLVLMVGCSSATPVEEVPPVLGPPAQREFLDEAYAPAHVRQRLDLYLPPTGDGPWPVVLWIHGGGWSAGDKSLAASDPVLRLRTRGYAVASIGYRLSQQATFPAQIHDVKAAVRYLRQNARGYRLIPTKDGCLGLIRGWTSGGAARDERWGDRSGRAGNGLPDAVESRASGRRLVWPDRLHANG
jgi:hypothetical protein